MGEYNAVADTLEIINDTIRFQGKAGGLLVEGGLLSCSLQAQISSEGWGQAQSPWLPGEEGTSFPLIAHTHSLSTVSPSLTWEWGHWSLRGVLPLTGASTFKPIHGQE